MKHGVDLALGTFQTALAVASVVMWLTILDRKRRGVAASVAEPRQAVPWTGVDVLLLAIVAFFFEIAAQSVIAGGASSDGISLANVVAVALSRAAWIVFALVLLTVRTSAPLAALGFDTSREASDLRLAGRLFLASVLPVYGLQVLLNTALGLESDHPLVSLVAEQNNVGVLAVVTLVAVVVAPLVEEFLFRVLLQGWLEKRQVAAQEVVEGEQHVPGYAPMVISALFFGLLHVGHGADPIPLFVLGLFLGYAYRQTHRIIAPLAMHMMVNGVAMIELWAIFFRGGR